MAKQMDEVEAAYRTRIDLGDGEAASRSRRPARDTKGRASTKPRRCTGAGSTWVMAMPPVASRETARGAGPARRSRGGLSQRYRAGR